MSRRTIALVAAIVLAAVATVALISYVQSRGNSKEVQKTLVAVFVAKDVIPQGTSGDTAISQGLITQIKVPQLARVDGAIGSLQEIKGEVAAVDIQKNEQILTSRFVAPGRCFVCCGAPSRSRVPARPTARATTWRAGQRGASRRLSSRDPPNP